MSVFETIRQCVLLEAVDAHGTEVVGRKVRVSAWLFIFDRAAAKEVVGSYGRKESANVAKSRR